MPNKPVPKFLVREEQADISTQVRVQRINNGFVVRTGSDPIFYPDIESAADAIKEGLIAARWPNAKEKNNDRI